MNEYYKKILFIFKAIRRYRIVYKNWVSVILSVRSLKPTKVIFRKRDDIKYTISSELAVCASYYLSEHNGGIKDIADFFEIFSGNFQYKNKKIQIKNIENGDPMGVFFNEEYKFLNVNNEIVIDIGANIGDSAIYFAIEGAKKVISLEPYPYSYRISLENIKINQVENKVILLNAGYGEDKIVKIDENYFNKPSSDLKIIPNGKNIKLFSLKSLLDEYVVENNDAVLKVDCEGCEYNILKETLETIRRFKKICIEYHYGYADLKKKLEESGFTVKITKPDYSYNRWASNPNMYAGYIFAERN